MPTPFPYAERSIAVRAAIQAKLAADKLAFISLPSTPRVKVLAETVVEGRRVDEWDKDIFALEDAADDQRRATGKLVVLDFAEHFPAKAAAAVAQWRGAGRPTEFDEAAAAIQKARDEAEKWAKLAVTEDGKVEKFEEMKNAKKAEQHRRYAQTNRDKAAKFLAQAETLYTEWKKEHP